ncbi:methyl-accepting chemotaxis protein [Desulfosediminicola flagellatus]|uniref:methyl-accepting chemotaxis protein n=1 Tax=Desulfosediminicola flagellatus TaxID=2569541 RepID=UPI00142F090A|nr:methyl-accepting chemotaxis protein [Desulfosediminicola flagellatus]
MKWKDVSLRVKLGSGFAALILLVIILAFSAEVGIKKIIDDAEEVISSNHMQSVIDDVEVAHLRWATSVAMHLLDETDQKLDVVLDDHQCSFGKWLYGEGRRTAEAMVPSLRPLLKAIEQPHYDLHSSAQTIIEARSGSGGVDDARRNFLINSAFLVDKFSANLDKIRLEIDRKMITTPKMLDRASHQRSLIIWMITGIILLGLIIYVVLSESIRSPLIKAIEAVRRLGEGDVDVSLDINRKDEIGELAGEINLMVAGQKKKAIIAQSIADGDLTVDVEMLSDKDVLGNALMKMVESHRTVISKTDMVEEQKNIGANEVASVSRYLSESATASVDSIEDISSSMGNNTTNALNAGQGNQLSPKSQEVADRGDAHMHELIGAMREINDASQNISQVIKVIDEIAFQTNLLALNTDVEAARAGQHGKGFASVAEEARSLAARSAKAASETAELIEGFIEKVRQGTTIADQTAHALQEIVEGPGK